MLETSSWTKMPDTVEADTCRCLHLPRQLLTSADAKSCPPTAIRQGVKDDDGDDDD